MPMPTDPEPDAEARKLAQAAWSPFDPDDVNDRRVNALASRIAAYGDARVLAARRASEHPEWCPTAPEKLARAEAEASEMGVRLDTVEEEADRADAALHATMDQRDKLRAELEAARAKIKQLRDVLLVGGPKP